MQTKSTGKLIRTSRFRYPGHSTGLIVPLDHGLTIGPVKGVRNVREIETWIGHPAICAIVAHKGMIERLAGADALQGKGIILHLNGMSTFAPTPNQKELLTSMETAAAMGVDGVSVQVNFDGECDARNMVLLGSVVDDARRFGLPVLTMLYDKVMNTDESLRLERLRHLIRVAIELGTDSIKLAPPKTRQELHAVLEDACEDVAIYFAGGELGSDDDLLSLASEGIHLGSAGLCVGRNIFQRTEPHSILNRLKATLTTSAPRTIAIPSRSVVLANVMTS
jgi:fructose-bisphosphate aldolase, class I